MNAVRVYLVVHVILSACVGTSTSNFFSSLLERIGYSSEYCDSPWISFDATVLKADLKGKLFGQHIASRIILKAVTGFMRNKNPKKPLVLSLHGWTGTGKSFVSQLIAKNIYKEGMDSNFVHVFTKTHVFYHITSETEYYKLQQWIKEKVTNCPRSMFIFDDMDKVHPGLIDSIKPYLDYHKQLDGVSYRKAIFIFLSNAGGESITQTALDFWKKQHRREEIELKDLEESLSDILQNEKGGLWHSSLINDNLVDFFVPFLPLEYQHVVQCVLACMEARRLPTDKDIAERLAGDFTYSPKFERVFATKGCKTVDNRLHFYTFS